MIDELWIADASAVSPHLACDRGDRSCKLEVALHEAEVLAVERSHQHRHAVSPDVHIRRVIIAHEATDPVDQTTART